jgi:hypothetical protein
VTTSKIMSGYPQVLFGTKRGPPRVADSRNLRLSAISSVRRWPDRTTRSAMARATCATRRPIVPPPMTTIRPLLHFALFA